MPDMITLPHVDDPRMEKDPLFIDPVEIAALTPIEGGTCIVLRGGGEVYTSLSCRATKVLADLA